MQEMPRGRPRRTQGRTQRPTKEVTGKPDDIERVPSGLAGGRRKRGRKTTSPAAYPTRSAAGGHQSYNHPRHDGRFSGSDTTRPSNSRESPPIIAVSVEP